MCIGKILYDDIYMKNNLIITIGRQFGSGGREIGQRLAKLFDIAYYDKELIQEAAKESGLSSEYFERADETAPGSLRNILTMSWATLGNSFGNDGTLSNENIFKYQSDVIIHLAEDHPSVFVGRCADYILRENPMCFNVFIHAPLKDRIERIMKRDHISKAEAMELASKKNKCRANYYNYYTDKEWGAASSYDLSIDSSKLGCEATALYIYEFIQKVQKGNS